MSNGLFLFVNVCPDPELVIYVEDASKRPGVKTSGLVEASGISGEDSSQKNVSLAL